MNDEGGVIECSGCKEWCHKECSGLNRTDYSFLEKSKKCIQWLCPKCMSANEENPVPGNGRTRFEAKLDRILELVNDLDSRLVTLEKVHSSASIENIIEEKVDKKVKEAMEEMEEKRKRKNNIIVVNIPESDKDNVEERMKEDLAKVKTLIEKVTDGQVSPDEISKPVRLGKVNIGNSKKPRLLKLTIKTDETKQTIMKNAHKLNKGVPIENRVYINHDQTNLEREQFRNLRAELKRRVAEGETDIVIRGDKIVKKQTPNGLQSQIKPSSKDCDTAKKDQEASAKQNSSGKQH